ncbi:uncharacterized protein LOC131320820 isoform X1 [Rhododendron vialii]|uniref:uncharacterized protein LOC131320820 isoform X1 n=1 Tax=Rhododendron vialii TaxID=182163 RepID=UPI00265D951D|nr:uncharacterized protein LOC131320820 isoform X1 [Rhododendron vialii]
MCTPQGIIEHLGCMVFDEAVTAVTKAGKYVCHYRTNLDNLQREMTTLEVRREKIEREVKEAHDRGEEIEEDVLQWQKDVDTMKNYVQNLVGQSTDEAEMHCFACSCPNIKWRYRLSKQAEEKIEDVKKLAQESHFDKISRPKPPPPELEFPSAENFIHLDSRTPILEDIVGALRDPEVKMIGVYGLGGVGKTTLVEKVAKKMLDDGTFKQVPLVAVSKDHNVKDIQKKLADKLNLTLDATKDEKGKLWNKFKNGEKYLVILDDIWEEVDLKAIGIPVMEGNIGCKVLLASRKEDLLRITMKADRNFPIAELPEGEGWNLFKKKIGNTIESRPEIDSLAHEVCRKCKGLPVAINALGAAVKDRPYHTWKNALDKLERHMLTQIEGINRSVWATLWVSYDMLPSSDAQSCFLLCCLFAEDAKISIDELTRHCMARSLLAQNPRTFDEARTAMCTVVDVLKSASLLSTEDHETIVKIHDVIRDVGISIAREKEAFLVDHGALQWPRNPTNGPLYKAMSLSFKNVKHLPDGLVYPELETLMVDNSELADIEVPDNFFNGMMQLTVLTFTRMHMQRLPSSLVKLTNLRMLYLNRCELEDIAILKDLKNDLEVLSLRGSNIEALPSEIRQLTSLRVLDLQDCNKLKVIPRGVTSNLTSLEELYFPENFDKWGATIDEQQDTSSRENLNLEELRRSLSTDKLTTLHFYIPDVMLLPKEDLIFVNLKRFKISVGSIFNYSEKLISGRCMLKLEGIQLRNEFIPLVDKADVLVLREIEGLKKVFHDKIVGNRFLDLKYLKVTSCVEDLEYLIGESKSSGQSHELHRLQSFNNLTVLIIEDCKSKYLFSPTTAKGLIHLEELEVRSCKIMEGIVRFERRNDEDELTSEVKFSKLKQLKLKDLPNLLSFYAQKEKMEIIMGSSSSCAQPLFSEKVIFPVLERLIIDELGNIIKIWDKQSIAVLEEQGSFCQLRDLEVSRCSKLMHVFPSNMHPLLKNLKFLEVQYCETMKGIAEFEGEIKEDVLKNEVASPAQKHLEIESWCRPVNNDDIIVFPRLKRVKLWTLPKLKSFYTETQGFFSHKVIFPVLMRLIIDGLGNTIKIWDKQSIAVLKEQGSFCQLTSLEVRRCSKLMHVFPSNMHPLVKNLHHLEVSDCEIMKGIAEFEGEIDEDGLRNEVASLAQEHLEMVEVTEIQEKQPLPKPRKEVESLCKLISIRIKKCNELLYVFPSHMLPQNLQGLWIEECDELEVIFSTDPKEEKEAINDDIIVFPRLERVTLCHLPKLRSFYTETQGFFSHKVAFPVLQNLYFHNLDKITRIWDNQPLSEPEKEAKSFWQLMKINVCYCNQLENVLPCYMLPQLKNLQELSMWNCTKVEVIISNHPKEKEATNNNDTIRFPQFKTLQLGDLPNLKSFICCETQLLFSNKVIFPVLKKLSIQKVHKIIEIWDKQSIAVLEEQGSFCQLTDLDVSECEKLMHVFPFKMHSPLKNLKVLRVSDCPTMEGIVEFEGEIDEDGLKNEDAFPVLEEIYLDEDSEILRDGTYTKENNKMADTSAAQARKGKDIQGIPWERLNITREKYRQTRLEQYENYENIPQSGKRSEKDCNVTMKGGMYYEFRRNSRSVKSTIPHLQIRNMVWATSKHDVYLMSHFSVTHWSALTCNKTEVLNVSGHVAPCEKHPGSLLEGFTRTEVSTLAVKDRLLVAGGFQGELICKNLDRPGVCFCTRTTDVNAVTNVVEIYNSQSGAVHFTVANNDCGVRDFDMEKFQLSKHFSFPWPVNHTSLSPDGKHRIIVGDSPEGMLVDSGTGKMVASLVGHLDFSTASAWHPDGLTFATGNQDKTCRIWDARNLSKSVAALKGNLGAIRSIRYSSDGRFLAMAEPADFVHVFDAKSGYEKEQEIDFFGEISGMSFSPDTESLFIGVCSPIYGGLLGVCDPTYGGGLLEFGRRRNNSCPDSII